MKPVWMSLTNVKTKKEVRTTKVSVIMNLPEGSNPAYIAYDEETDLLLLSRDLAPSGGWKALDLEKGLIGTVNCQAQVYYTRKQKQDTESPFVKQRSNNSYAAPVTNIQNDSDRTIPSPILSLAKKQRNRFCILYVSKIITTKYGRAICPEKNWRRY